MFINDTNSLILCLWVDDILIFSKDKAEIQAFKDRLSQTFKMTDEGLCKYYLGIHVKQKPGSIRLHQARYMDQLLNKYGYTDAAKSKTPRDPNAKLQKRTDSLAEPGYKLRYSSKVSSLNFLGNQTRPDVAFPVGYTARYTSNPHTSHADAVSHIFHYLKGSKDLGLLYTKEAGLILEAFADSDHGNCPDTRKSTTGYVFKLAGAPIMWKSKRQDTVALSTMDAEYIAAAAAAT